MDVVKTRITEAAFEKVVARAVQNRLQRSNRYRNAASAEEQQQIEDEIEEQVVAEYEARYEVATS